MNPSSVSTSTARHSPLADLRRNGILTDEVATQLAETGENLRIRGPKVKGK